MMTGKPLPAPRKVKKSVFSQYPVGIEANGEKHNSEIQEKGEDVLEDAAPALSSPGIKMQIKGIGESRAVREQLLNSIVWKRKHLAPSIPIGKFSFGYQENTEGDMVPRGRPSAIVRVFAFNASHLTLICTLLPQKLSTKIEGRNSR